MMIIVKYAFLKSKKTERTSRKFIVIFASAFTMTFSGKQMRILYANVLFHLLF